ncbi:MAG: DUF6502 family protein [Bdellovibrionota bacterium]|nr:MAG: DUF6502 family protein [Bdellovibrionota bacterium]
METTARVWFKSLLRPLVAFALSKSLSFREFSAIARELYIDAAAELLRDKTAKVNTSRIAALTGLHRREVNAIRNSGAGPTEPALSIPQRVLNRWEQDKQFTTSRGRPKVLSFGGPTSDFSVLVRSVSSSLNSGTVLFELERIGAVSRTAKGIRMSEDFHRFGADPEKAFAVVGSDIGSLLHAVDENVFRRKKLTNVHLRTEYDNVFAGDLPKIRGWLSKEAGEFHRKLRKFLSRSDKDLVKDRVDEDAGCRVAITSFSLTDDF